MVKLKYIFLGLITVLFLLNEQGLMAQENKKIYSLYFMGDLGADPTQTQSIESMKAMNAADEKSGIILLGDHAYPSGVGNGEKTRENRERLQQQLRTLGGNGDLFVIPGERDWDNGNKRGNRKAMALQALVDSLKIPGLQFLPQDGCPGPIEIQINNEITLMVINLQWILHPWDKPREEDGCQSSNVSQVAYLIEDILKRNRQKKVIIAHHHPIYSVGEHMSKFPPSLQDLNNPVRYKPMTEALRNIYKNYDNLIVLSAHDRSMQYMLKRKNHHIIAGSSTQSTPLRSETAEYKSDEIGFGVIDFYKNGKVDLRFIKASDRSVLFEQELFNIPYTPLFNVDYSNLNFQGQTVTTNASDQYENAKSWLSGKNYRDVWKVEREFPVFDIGKEHGGLKILRRGGGLQTKSLRMEAADGKQYVLRSVEKYPIKAVPDILKTTIAADIIQDGISASHPYAAYVVPPMADAAGVYHTNPTVVYIPDDPRFGEYQADFANTICLYEERLSGNWEGFDNFGGSKKLQSTIKMLDKLYEDNDNYVDQQWFLKSRLFDMFIGDWDRHEDQWRWARFKDKDGDKFWRPIPRDRDQVFFINEGLIMWIAGRKWAQSRWQGFDHELSYVPGFNFNGRYVDREFLNELPLSSWQATADSLQERLTDDVIDNALKVWPQQVYDIRGDQIAAKLRSSRGNLKKYATEHYLFLSEAVNVLGSNKRELFEINRVNDNETDITVRKISKKGNTDKIIYHRKFFTNETDEVRLYGLAGEDKFKVTGDVNKSIKVRIIGGPDSDEIIDESRVSGWGKKTQIYDTKEENTLTLSKESKDRTSNELTINDYNRKEFRYNKLIPLVSFNFNVDDGIFLGGGFINTQHGFRKEPYKLQQKLSGQVAFATGSFQFEYNVDFVDALGKWDIEFDAKAFGPNFITNFFGIGNESEFDQDIDEVNTELDDAIDYYRTRFQLYTTQLFFKRDLGPKATFSIGPHTQIFKVERGYGGESRFIRDFGDTIPDFYDYKTYQGLVLKFEYDSRNSTVFPRNGLHIDLDLRGYKGVNEDAEDFTRFMGSVSYYKTIRIPAKVVFATVVGGGHNFGDYEFFQAQILSGTQHLRGFRRTRFFGDSKLYNNIELRTRLFTFKNRVAPMTVGLQVFHDIGRVWVEGEDSDKWHNGFGAGISLSPINVFTFTFDVAYSEEEVLPYVKLGWRF